MKIAEAGNDINHSMEVRNQVLSQFREQAEEVRKLQEFITNLPVAIEQEGGMK